MKSQSVVHHQKGPRSRSTVIWSFCHVRSLASSLFDRITSYVAYIQHMRDDVLHSIFRIKDQRWRSHGSFEVFTLSNPWDPPYLTESLHMCHTYNTRGAMCHALFQNERSNVKCRFKSLLCQLHGFIHILLNHFICSMHTADEGTMYRTPFSGWKVICHPGRLKFLPCPLRVFLIIPRWNGSNMLVFGG